MNEELERQLAQALLQYIDNNNKYINETEIKIKNNFYKDFNKINNEINLINNKYNIYKNKEEHYGQRKYSIDEENDWIRSFLTDSQNVLTFNSPQFLKRNEDVVIASLKRDIDSIIYVGSFTEKIKSIALEEAIRQGYMIDKYTPRFMLENEDFVINSIGLDINTIKYVPERLQTKKIVDIATSKALESGYVITDDSPEFFKRSIDIVKNSIEFDPNSINYIQLYHFNGHEKELIDLILKSEKSFLFNNSSSDELTNNLDLCFLSIKNSIDSARYIPQKLIDSSIELKNYLITHDFYPYEDFKKFNIINLKDEEIRLYYLSKLGYANTNGENTEQDLAVSRLSDFINDILSKPIQISDMQKVFQMIATKEWERYRSENDDYYTNLFNRICDSLEKNKNFISAINELKFLLKVDDVLDERKYALFNAFIEYHHIYHNPNIKNKVELLQEKRDDISKNSALFISKSKEEFISEKIRILDESFKKFFIIKIDNPIVKKKVIEIKQREMLKYQFNSNDMDLLKTLEEVKSKYFSFEFNDSVDKSNLNEIFNLFISKIINDNVSSIEDVLDNKPDRFDEYERFEKVSKLINRLNSNNITFGGTEVEKYKHLISFDGNDYYYNGTEFSETELKQILAYKDLKFIFGKIKSDIIQLAKTRNKIMNITEKDIQSIIDECPFTDEYYSFNFDSILSRYRISTFDTFVNSFEDSKEILLDNHLFSILNSFVVNQGLTQFSLISYLGEYDDNKDKGFEMSTKNGMLDTLVPELISSMKNIRMLVNDDEFTIENIDKILDFKDIFKYADLSDISILGKELIKKIYTNNGFTSSSQSTRIKVACDLVSEMPKKTTSTIPFINGNFGNYKYSMYDSTDINLLSSGLDTQACFRVCGNDNDFLHYCALDKNGFVIKLTDKDGNFIGRASGFRNGNGVYINQLRTIYDKSSSAYQSEKEAIIETFKKACSDIVNTSQNNNDEEHKIDFVVVTKSYSLESIDSNVNNEVAGDAIGDNPMDTLSADWQEFVSTTPNLRESERSGYFTTDFGNYSLICMSSAIGGLSNDKIKKGDVPAVYHRERQSVEIGTSNQNIEETINRIRAIKTRQKNEKFEYFKIPKDAKIIMGDNWFIVFNENRVVEGCYLNNDENAKKEYDTSYQQLTSKIQEDAIAEQEQIYKGR